ncbi:hypothetical protein [Bradyrhizobium sp. i1.15.2]|uniref:hypothetical protein n=1 Tax=Bradyrhizobium sp. i1.15.2 TaxID=3156362 RepID=UPI003399C308
MRDNENRYASINDRGQEPSEQCLRCFFFSSDANDCRAGQVTCAQEASGKFGLIAARDLYTLYLLLEVQSEPVNASLDLNQNVSTLWIVFVSEAPRNLKGGQSAKPSLARFIQGAFFDVQVSKNTVVISDAGPSCDPVLLNCAPAYLLQTVQEYRGASPYGRKIAIHMRPACVLHPVSPRAWICPPRSGIGQMNLIGLHGNDRSFLVSIGEAPGSHPSTSVFHKNITTQPSRNSSMLADTSSKCCTFPWEYAVFQLVSGQR